MKKFQQEIFDLLNDYIDNQCDIYGMSEVIRDLINLGASKELLIAMGFDEEDIDTVKFFYGV